MKKIATLIAAVFFAIFCASLVQTVQAEFAQQGTYGGVSGGTANAQTISIPNVASLSQLRGVTISFTVGAGLTDTGPATLQVNSISAVNIDRMNSGALAALSGGEMPAGKMMQAFFDGTEFVLLTNYATGTPIGQVAYFDQSTCPAGWIPANGSGGTANVTGQFIRALNTGATGIDPNRTLASIETQSVQALGWSGSASTSMSSVTGGLYVGAFVLSYQTSGSGAQGASTNQGSSRTLQTSDFSLSTSVSGSVTGTGTETRPQNVALLACQAQ